MPERSWACAALGLCWLRRLMPFGASPPAAIHQRSHSRHGRPPVAGAERTIALDPVTAAPPNLEAAIIKPLGPHILTIRSAGDPVPPVTKTLHTNLARRGQQRHSRRASVYLLSSRQPSPCSLINSS